VRQAGEHVLEIVLGVDPVHLTVEQHGHDDGALDARILGSEEEPVFLAEKRQRGRN